MMYHLHSWNKLIEILRRKPTFSSPILQVFVISDVPEYDDIFKDSDDEMDDGDENDSAQANGLGENETDDDLDSNPMSKRKR